MDIITWMIVSFILLMDSQHSTSNLLKQNSQLLPYPFPSSTPINLQCFKSISSHPPNFLARKRKGLYYFYKSKKWVSQNSIIQWPNARLEKPKKTGQNPWVACSSGTMPFSAHSLLQHAICTAFSLHFRVCQ